MTDQSLDSARRRFTRNAVVGSVVVASLGNRAAWGQEATATCMSVSILQSFATTGAFLSAHPNRDEHIEGTAEEILSRPDDQYTPDGTTLVCVDPEPEGPSLLESDGKVGRKGKRDVRRGLLDGGPLQ